MKKILYLLGLVALAAGSAQAAVYTWTGGATTSGANRIGDWNNDWEITRLLDCEKTAESLDENS